MKDHLIRGLKIDRLTPLWGIKSIKVDRCVFKKEALWSELGLFFSVSDLISNLDQKNLLK